ncbi:MAG TPA: Type 1 glutamine amidotransferase-like domain-containing protein, partial [Saprospiraceae bacterium]|nr:Type 1 glutamine amidotransferase-like domain-containing protein [Saprospiraceae bacterium]
KVMVRFLNLIFCLSIYNGLAAQSYTSYFTGNRENIETQPLGGVCLMGGSTENDSAMIWFLSRANGGDVLVLRASGSNGYNDYMYTKLGVQINSVESIVWKDSSASFDPYVIDKIKKAEAIWMAGGDQWNYVRYWRNSPVDSLINLLIKEKNIVIGGTSAGMAVLGQYYFSAKNNTVTSPDALANPFD